MRTPAEVQAGARRDSHRYYVAELRKQLDAIGERQEALVDLVADLDSERFYAAPETKGTLRDAAMGLGAIKRTVEAALRELPAP